jgi:hypothetical protein
MSVRAIETRYAGCLFRSRLEARWAVFLNELGMEWQYEPEGLEVTPLGERPMKWLPDFWLASGQWAEVKGELSPESALRLILLASEVAQCGSGHDVVVLGHIPKVNSLRWPVQLHRHGDLWAVPWTTVPGCPLTQDGPRIALRGDVEISLLLEGIIAGVPTVAEPALDAARTARFEWGANGGH